MLLQNPLFLNETRRVPKSHVEQELETLELQVQFVPGEDIVLGRDSRLERRELLILSLRSSVDRALRHKELLVSWMEHCYGSFVKPVEALSFRWM